MTKESGTFFIQIDHLPVPSPRPDSTTETRLVGANQTTFHAQIEKYFWEHIQECCREKIKTPDWFLNSCKFYGLEMPPKLPTFIVEKLENCLLAAEAININSVKISQKQMPDIDKKAFEFIIERFLGNFAYHLPYQKDLLIYERPKDEKPNYRKFKKNTGQWKEFYKNEKNSLKLKNLRTQEFYKEIDEVFKALGFEFTTDAKDERDRERQLQQIMFIEKQKKVLLIALITLLQRGYNFYDLTE